MPLHFGYGSNISRNKLLGNLYRTELGTPVYDELEPGVVARLPGHRFALRPNGTANLIEDAECEAYGVLYNLTELQYDRIWDYEGRTAATIEKPVRVITGSEEVEAHTWVFVDQEAHSPAPYYIELIVEAALARPGFPRTYIDDVLSKYLHQNRLLPRR